MRNLETENPAAYAIAIILLWAVVFTLLSILLSSLLANLVVAGLAGGIAFALSSLFIHHTGSS